MRTDSWPNHDCNIAVCIIEKAIKLDEGRETVCLNMNRRVGATAVE